MHAQGQASSTLRLTQIESEVDDAGGSCPLFVAGYDVWDGLSLEYRVPWPVHLLLTKPVRRSLHPNARSTARQSVSEPTPS